MADAVGHLIRRIGRDNLFDGDVYITNDPWEGTGHLHDITMVTPSFYNGALVGFFACTAHVVDVGGRGFGADAHSVYEEGLYIPIMKFADHGTVDDTLVRIIRCNVREPDQLIGDVYALATCNEIGHRRLAETLTEFGFDQPITLKCNVSVQDDPIVTDFTGTSGVNKKGINCPMVYAKAYARYALKVAIAPEIPDNAASLAPFEVTSPENTIVNARRAEVLTFNSGGSGARPDYDGLNATAFPGGAGYGDPALRDPAMVKRDLARGYISAAVTMRDYGLSQEAVDDVAAPVLRGEVL